MDEPFIFITFFLVHFHSTDYVGTLKQGYQLLLQQGRTRIVIRDYAIRGGAAGPHGSGSYLTRPTARTRSPLWEGSGHATCP